MTLFAYFAQSANHSRLRWGMELTLKEQYIHLVESPQTSRFSWKAAALIAFAGLLVFGSGVTSNSFEDEYAYISQAYYADLLFSGQHNHKEWMDLPAYDLPPLPKYLIGSSMRAAGLPMPRPANAYAWYRTYRPFGGLETLTIARLPIVPIGVAGCLALFGIGSLVGDRRAGAIGALLLIANPLYRLHAHRAMSDVPCEAFLLLGLYAGLASWRSEWTSGASPRGVLLAMLTGVCLGLALLCKFNALLGLMVVGAWALYALAVPSIAIRHKLTMLLSVPLTAAITFSVFIALNPFMTAHPPDLVVQPGAPSPEDGIWDRFVFQIRHRLKMSRGQQAGFSHNALQTEVEKAKVFLVQGFGRFGPFGTEKSNSKVRYDPRQDWGVLLWAPIVILGVIQILLAARRQARSGLPRLALALLIWCGVTWTVVAYYLPMAWDRYLLPIQSVNSLLAGFGITAIWDRWKRRGSIT